MARATKDASDIDPKTIGRRLRDLRKARGWSQSTLAQKVGLTQTLVSDYEIGRLRLHAGLLIRFARALQVSTDELLGIKDVKPNGASHDRRFLRRLEQIDKLSRSKKQVLLSTIDSFLRGELAARHSSR